MYGGVYYASTYYGGLNTTTEPVLPLQRRTSPLVLAEDDTFTYLYSDSSQKAEYDDDNITYLYSE